MNWKNITREMQHNFTFRLLLVILAIIAVGLFAIEVSLRLVITRELLREKEQSLFGLTAQLDLALEGTFDAIVLDSGGDPADREASIALLNSVLTPVTDFVATGLEGVGVGYYHRTYDAIITYGPSDQFAETVGQSIFEGHQGYEVMEKGKPLVQQGQLVRGRILNCMYPIIRDGEVIGYIWANQTLDAITADMNSIRQQVFSLLLIVFIFIYLTVVATTRGFIGQIDVIRDGIQKVISQPGLKLDEIPGELNIIVQKVNELVGSVSYFKSYNRYVIDSVVNGVLALTDTGSIALLNPTIGEMFQFDPDEVRGEAFTTVFSDPVLSILKEGLIGGGQLPPRVLSFNDRILEVLSNPVRNESAERLGVVFIFRDITLVRQYERQLKNNDRLAAMGEMGLNLAHEIKNPLTAVKGFTQLIQKRNLPDHRRAYFTSLIDEELERVNSLLNEILVYGGKSRLQPEEVDLAALLQELLIIYRSVHQEIDFTFETNSAVCLLNLDKNKMTQVFDNLVKNAVDSIRSESSGGDGRGAVVIELREDGDSVRVSVTDDGPGIDPGVFDKIFTPFYTTKSHGTGFGLSLCSEVMERHRGSIKAESIPGDYTTFILEFSRSQMEDLNGR